MEDKVTFEINITNNEDIQIEFFINSEYFKSFYVHNINSDELEILKKQILKLYDNPFEKINFIK